jgi:hypothetical protein
MAQVVRSNGRWIEIIPKPYEPDRQTHEIAWSMIRTSVSPSEAYRTWYAGEQKKVSVVYPSFRKETHGT